MNELLLDSIRHNNWATKQLVAFCRDAGLTEDQLLASGAGMFGGILATLNHVITSDASYIRALAGSNRGWYGEDTDLEGLAARAEENEKLWEHLLSGPIDVERVIVVDDGLNEVRAGVFLAQALNHANHHRAQVRAILTGLGFKAPDVQAWEYAWATGRLWARTAGVTKPEDGRSALGRRDSKRMRTRGQGRDTKRTTSIPAYDAAQSRAAAGTCRKLRAEIERALPDATSKVWHGAPVWFVGETPVVGYSVAKHGGVVLLFWNGQAFDDPALEPMGKFKAAQVVFRDASEIKLAPLRRWLKRAGTELWDVSSIRKRAARSR